MPPLEFTPRLIKATDSSSSIREFPVLLSECAEGMQRFSPGSKNGDIGASLRFYASGGALARIALPRDLRGFSVLDIGAFDGYFSFEAQRRRGQPRACHRQLRLARQNIVHEGRLRTGRVSPRFQFEDRNVDVMEVSPENVGRFDVVLLLGVLYHLRHPLLALERVRSVTKQLLILRDPRRSYEHPAPRNGVLSGRGLEQRSQQLAGPKRSLLRRNAKHGGLSKHQDFWQGRGTRGFLVGPGALRKNYISRRSLAVGE
jgi:hypothetical protein